MPRAERWNCSSVLQANELSGNSSITDRTSPYTSEWRNRPEIARLSLTKPDIEPRTRINQHSVGARASTISPRMPPHRPRNSRRMGLAIRSRIQNTPFTKQKMIPVLANHRRTGQASEIFNGWVGEGAIRVREIHGRCTTEVISWPFGYGSVRNPSVQGRKTGSHGTKAVGGFATDTAVFFNGTTGYTMYVSTRCFDRSLFTSSDSWVRRALWQDELDYRHGTGHRVGHFLNVHE